MPRKKADVIEDDEIIEDDAGPTRSEKRQAMVAEVIRLKDEEGKTFKQIAEELNLNIVTVSCAYQEANIEKADVEATPAIVKRERDINKMGWAPIGWKYGITKAKVKELYESAGGDPTSRVSRAKAEDNGGTTAKKAAGTTKKATTRRGAKPKFSDDMTLAEVSEMLSGKTVGWKMSTTGRDTSVKVKTVTKVGSDKNGKRLAEVTVVGGKPRIIPLEAVHSIS